MNLRLVHWLKYPVLTLGTLVSLALLIALFWALVKIATHGQSENQYHLQYKQEYLLRIQQSSGVGPRPNIVFILFDDLGYGDLGVTGSEAIETPNMDRLAQRGVVLNNFYSPAPVCTPARAGFLTGRLPLRAGMPQVVMPSNSVFGIVTRLFDYNKRIPAEEITLADVLGAAGYATGMVGKWHLGDQSPSLPNDMGFQEFFGALYSNDMEPFDLYRDREIAIPAPADQTRLNEWYGDEAARFIKAHSSSHFFLYLPHNFPHIPLYAAENNIGRSAAGLYGDVVESLDDLVDKVVKTLESEGVLDNTLILITSDNGPWYQGSAGGDRGRKGETFEGGMHVPMIVHWPSVLPAGQSLDGLSMGTDWFPTILDWLQLPLPADRIIDGRSLRAMLEHEAGSPNDYLYFFMGEELLAIRDQRYKYHRRRAVTYVLADSIISPGQQRGPWLFDTTTDHNESYDVSMRDLKTAQRMDKVLTAKRREMEENKRGWMMPATSSRN
ncbi:MAG: sulfatase [Gammaproteobacteria bacterium]|nr:sulfatase [Gammaproteobacteria bacterium]